MGNDKSKKYTSESTASMLRALEEFAPGAISALSATAPGVADTQYNIEATNAPKYAALQNQVYQDYGPEANRIGSEIARNNALAASETERQLAEGPGAALVSLAGQEQQQLDPEFYKSRALVGDAIGEYLKSYSPTELTGSELEQINRGISARSGPMTESALNTVKNAQTFGSALTDRWKNFGDAVLKASSALPSLKSGLTGFEIATRRPLTSNTGESRLTTPQGPNSTSALNTSFGFGNSLINEIGSNQRASLAKQKDAYDKVASITGLIGGIN